MPVATIETGEAMSAKRSYTKFLPTYEIFHSASRGYSNPSEPSRGFLSLDH